VKADRTITGDRRREREVIQVIRTALPALTAGFVFRRGVGLGLRAPSGSR